MTELANTVLAFKNIIDGKFVVASDGATIDMLSPSNGQVFASISRSSHVDVDKGRCATDAGSQCRTGRTSI